MPDDIYHAGPGYSSSQLKVITAKSELHFKAAPPIKNTKALKVGRVLHAFVLEPETVDGRFLFRPGLDARTKKGKEALAEAEATGLEVIREDPAQLEAIAAAVHEHPAWRYIVGAEPLVEPSIYWTDEETGLLLRVRPDNLNPHFGQTGKFAMCVDLKSAADARDRKFRNQVRDLGYDFSAAMYCDGVRQLLGRHCAWAWFVFEKEAPWATRVIYAGEKWLGRGRTLYRNAVTRLKQAEDTGRWPGYDNGKAVELEFTRWDELAQGDTKWTK